MAIVDPDLAGTMPKKLTAHSGMDAMTHAIEAYVSTLCCDYTDPLALHAIKMVSEFLIPSYHGNMTARDSIHNAQCLAGMAFSNAMLGIVHSMAHKTGAVFVFYVVCILIIRHRPNSDNFPVPLHAILSLDTPQNPFIGGK